MFRFPSPRPLWWWVGQSGKTKKKHKNKKKKGNKESTLKGVWVPEKSGLLSKKAWLQSQLENVVFSTFYSLGSRQVQMLDSAIHRTNHYPADKYWENKVRQSTQI